MNWIHGGPSGNVGTWEIGRVEGRDRHANAYLVGVDGKVIKR